jgi:hypothetical protein
VLVCCGLLLFLWLSSLPQPSWGESLGLQRLFTTPQQRKALDKERIKPTLPGGGEPELPKPPPYITFNGLVSRSVGPTTIWMNNESSSFQSGFNIEEQQRQGLVVPIQLAGQRKGFTLKPGQTLNTLNGEIQENFELEPNNYEPQ